MGNITLTNGPWNMDYIGRILSELLSEQEGMDITVTFEKKKDCEGQTTAQLKKERKKKER